MEQIWLTWAKRLQAIASTGQHFTSDDYDRERYDEVANISQQMLSLLGNVPIRKIESLVSDFAKGYATPRVDVRGAIIEDDKVLLVREVSDQLWTLPGGYADVGLSPSENVVKEIHEEACIAVTASSLYGVRHKAKHEYDEDARDFYIFFFLCERVDKSPPQPGLEISEVGYFGNNKLPPLSRGRVIEDDIKAAFAAHRETNTATAFD